MLSTVSVIIPTLNEERSIGSTLASLADLNRNVEIIVVDGGSTDRTIEIAQQFGALVISSDRGRGTQMHAGALAARTEALLFLHADTGIPANAIDQMFTALRDSNVVGGNFAVRFDGQTGPARFMTWLYPKLQAFGLSYGDSGIFIRADTYREIGGFKPIPLFEDLDLIKRLKQRGLFAHVPSEIVTSSRRFEGKHFTAIFARWIFLQVLYWCGMSPRRLSQLYAPVRNNGQNLAR